MKKIKSFTKEVVNNAEIRIHQYWVRTPWWKICLDVVKWGLRIAKWSGYSPFDGDDFGLP